MNPQDNSNYSNMQATQQNQNYFETNQQNNFPFAAFPANQPRDYDMNIRQMVLEIVERKYCPNSYIAKYQQLSAQDPNKYPPLDDYTISMIRSQGQDVSPEVRDFEVARVYNKLEIEIFEISNSYLPSDKQEELRKLTEQAQLNQSMSVDIISQIRSFMEMNVPNINTIIDEYMEGFVKQYLAGRY